MQELTLKIRSSRKHVNLFIYNILTVFLNFPASSVIRADVRFNQGNHGVLGARIPSTACIFIIIFFLF